MRAKTHYTIDVVMAALMAGACWFLAGMSFARLYYSY